MLRESDCPYVVLDDKMNRSMKDIIVQYARAGPGYCRLRQIIDLNQARNYHNGIPVHSLDCLLNDLKSGAINAVVDCTSSSIAAHILVGKMRDSSLQGPSLQKVHEETGILLADKLIDEIGHIMNLVEPVEFTHVKSGLIQC